MKSFARMLCVGLAALLAAAPAHAQQTRQQQQQPAPTGQLAPIDALMRNFESMAFGDAGERSKWTAVQRWKQPVQVVLIGEKADQFRDDVRSILAAFEALTGVTFSLADGDGGANLKVYFSERDWYRTQVARSFPRPDQVVCFTNTSVDANGVIGAANTVIPEDLSARAVRTCLAHELMHAIGFQGHPSRSFDSALRNGIGIDRLTINDQLLIRTLYDERLRFDMAPDEALTLATAIATALQAKVLEAKDPMDALAQRGRMPAPPPPWTGGPV
jgi:hypothetical protein